MVLSRQALVVAIVSCVVFTSFIGVPGKLLDTTSGPIKTVYFNVHGSSHEELCASLRSSGPIDDRSIRREAVTSWNIKWRWPLANSLPVYKGTEVAYSIELMIPRWAELGASDGALAAEWARYMKALLEHEQGHISRVINASKNLQANLRSFPSSVTTTEAETIAQNALSKLREEDRAYDLETRHGVNQGASLGCKLKTRKSLN